MEPLTVLKRLSDALYGRRPATELQKQLVVQVMAIAGRDAPDPVKERSDIDPSYRDVIALIGRVISELGDNRFNELVGPWLAKYGHQYGIIVPDAMGPQA